MIKKWFVIGIAIFMIVSGCSKSQQETDQNKNETPVKENDPTNSSSYPLTGISTKDVTNNRAVAVMINNHPEARPQSGLHEADIVYEVLAEGKVTRFLAIFQSEQPSQIGPVRSARDYYIDLAKGYDSLFVSHGYSPDAKKMLDSGYVDHIDGMVYDGTLFKRADFRQSPHNSYITYKNIVKGAKENKYKMDQAPEKLSFLTEDEVDAISGEDAVSVTVNYFSDLFSARYEYDEDLGKFTRFSNGEQTIDLDSEEPILLDNIFIIEAEHKVIDDAGRRAINFKSGGKGYLLQKGKWNEVEWKNIDGKILPFTNGKEAALVPGKTWINVIPDDQGLEQLVSFD
ncbi:DUF3048 domain-containing protein [Bacillus aquiflavi]|uniref:DUF3048 domain-containing protein n=1 Tax=Bacillus aquiflavi TaxID=2672567 RepID=UPI001CA988ED|nr:DUF3048 domain-containing protein [Bacillus aquiflavi]UAC48623.1 DUF3048 domain-containing protein [Bacillus aquiflavi]